jgi:hypothetical protein
MEDFAALSEPGVLAMFCIIKHCLPEFTSQLLPSRAPHSQEKKSLFLLTSMQTEGGIKETSRNHPTRGLEQCIGETRENKERKNVSKQYCVTSITFH